MKVTKHEEVTVRKGKAQSQEAIHISACPSLSCLSALPLAVGPFIPLLLCFALMPVSAFFRTPPTGRLDGSCMSEES